MISTLQWFNWKDDHKRYMAWFLESMESIEMIKFIVLVFALFAVSNKKLKIQYQKHQYFYSFQKRNQEKKKSWALCHLCCHFQILCNKRLFIFPEFWSADLNNQNSFPMQNQSGIGPDWSNRSVILASCKNHLHVHNCLEPQTFPPWKETSVEYDFWIEEFYEMYFKS